MAFRSRAGDVWAVIFLSEVAFDFGVMDYGVGIGDGHPGPRFILSAAALLGCRGVE